MRATALNPQLNQANSWEMFNAISSKYDFLNRFLSFGFDRSWRRELCRCLPQPQKLKILDLATGTGDVLLTLVQDSTRIQSATGIDLAEEMLNVGRAKIKRQGLDNKIQLQRGDVNQVPFADNHFDAITIAFGIRNVANPIIVLKEMFRCAKPSGRALVLEFSLPKNLLWRSLHLFYLRTVVPILGGIFSGNFRAYRYLNRTIEQFPYGELFGRMMKQVGFKNVKIYPLFGGIATVYQGDKAA